MSPTRDRECLLATSDRKRLLAAMFFICMCTLAECMQTACSMNDEEGSSDGIPDICVAYQLYSECGKFINLSDWMQASS